jgi:hypothetical protein
MNADYCGLISGCFARGFRWSKHPGRSFLGFRGNL